MTVVKINPSRGIINEIEPSVQPTRGDDDMEWQEKYIDNLNQDVSDIRSEMQGIRGEMQGMRRELKNDMAEMRQELKTEIREMRQEINATVDRALAEMRDRDNQRHQELLTIQNRIDNNVAGLTTEIKSTNKWIMGLVVTTVIGIAAITVAVIAFVATH